MNTFCDFFVFTSLYDDDFLIYDFAVTVVFCKNVQQLIMRRPIYIAGSIFWRLCLLVVTTASFSQNALRLLLGKGRENSLALS